MSDLNSDGLAVSKEVGARHLLVDHAGREAAHSLAAILLGEFGRDEAHLPHLAHQRPVEHAGAVPLLEAGSDTTLCKAPRVLRKRLQVFIDIGIHCSSWACRPGATYFAYLRKSGLRFSWNAFTPSRDSSVS